MLVTLISWVGMYSSTNFCPWSRCHKVLLPVFLSPRMTIFTWKGKKMHEYEVHVMYIPPAYTCSWWFMIKFSTLLTQSSAHIWTTELQSRITYCCTEHPLHSASVSFGSLTEGLQGCSSLLVAQARSQPTSSVQKTFWWRTIWTTLW